LLLCLFSEYKLIGAVFALFLVKECYMAVMGTRTIVKTGENEGAKWYGKISTAVFYLVMVALVFFPGIPDKTANLLILCCGGFMLLSFVMYARYYHLSQGKQGRVDYA
jgi:cardiolipin synthase